MFLDYFALGVLIFVFLVIFYGIIILHDIPYLIAKKRNHPHADAIHVAGWVSLFTLHVIWPFLWIWATLYRPERGWGMQNHDFRCATTTAYCRAGETARRHQILFCRVILMDFTDYFNLCGFRNGQCLRSSKFL